MDLIINTNQNIGSNIGQPISTLSPLKHRFTKRVYVLPEIQQSPPLQGEIIAQAQQRSRSKIEYTRHVRDQFERINTKSRQSIKDHNERLSVGSPFLDNITLKHRHQYYYHYNMPLQRQQESTKTMKEKNSQQISATQQEVSPLRSRFIDKRVNAEHGSKERLARLYRVLREVVKIDDNLV
ncbi:hypothetical protein FGO68_gene14798 [Halteria grandinella]|uniref:Uncharacterized protein n=1 Tax=Halteria grandinella TaxID=5974 RepID=A0A8J8SVV4_HALGN|nr:hypothetical protein FGO68_gene14798 [Halteria grandinella]